MKIEIITSAADNPVAEFFSSSSTPETDANSEDIGMGCQMVSAEFARKLERERDEAREQAQRLRVQLNHYSQVNELAEEAFRERDEIKEKYRFAVIHWQIGAAKMERERDQARDALMRIEDLFIDGTDVCADREKMGSIARAELEGTK